MVEEFKVTFRVDVTSPGGVQVVRRATILGTICMQVYFLNLEQEEVQDGEPFTQRISWKTF